MPGTFFTRETGQETHPVELVTLTRGDASIGRVWRYATGDTDITVRGLTFRAAALTRDVIRRSQDVGKTALSLHMAAATPFVAQWRALAFDPSRDGGLTTVVIQRLHLDSAGVPLTDLSTATVFVGTMSGMELDGEQATLVCDGLLTELERELPRVPISKNCPWPLYGRRCNVNPDDVAVSATIASMADASGDWHIMRGMPQVTLTMSGPAPDPVQGFVDGGVIVYTDPADANHLQRWFILEGDTSAWPTVVCIMQEPVPGALVGATVAIWPGCQKTFPVCVARFDNAARFGGFPEFPDRNPLLKGLV